MDADSVQSFLNQLVKEYGKVGSKLSKDLIASQQDQSFSHLMHQAGKFRSNNKQFAASQYCVGKVAEKQRQLWCVPWGQGKSRISATTAAIACMIGVVDTVYIVHENKHLMRRD